jgi:hypothetical protein
MNVNDATDLPDTIAPSSAARAAEDRLDIDPERVEQGLAKLVLTIIELLRQLLERQAIKRIEAESVTADEVERMGETFMNLEQAMIELKERFGLEGEDLNLNLGPLGNLL